MGCDMHLSLERCVRSTPDAATLSARLTCLMLAKRATKVDKSATATTMLWQLPTELWLRCAQLVTVTLVGRDKWVPCQWLAWLDISDKTWTQMFARGEVPPRPNDTRWDVGLDSRNYNAFALFSNQVGKVRSDESFAIKQLGCVKNGWPAGVRSRNSPELHSHAHCTLAGLFAVNWDAPCSSAAESGRSLRPTGPIDDRARRNRMDELVNLFGVHGFRGFAHHMQHPMEDFVMRMVPGLRDAATPEDQVRIKKEHIEIMLKGEGLGAALDEDEDDSQEDSNGAGSSAADAAATTSRRDVLGPHVVEGLAALEARLRQAGVSPAELRLIICFDN